MRTLTKSAVYPHPPEAVWVGTACVGVWDAPRSSERLGVMVCCWTRCPNPDSQGLIVSLDKVTV